MSLIERASHTCSATSSRAFASGNLSCSRSSDQTGAVRLMHHTKRIDFLPTHAISRRSAFASCGLSTTVQRTRASIWYWRPLGIDIQCVYFAAVVLSVVHIRIDARDPQKLKCVEARSVHLSLRRAPLSNTNSLTRTAEQPY